MQDILDKIGVNINVSFHLIYFTLIWVRIVMMTSVIPFLFGKPVPKYILVAASLALAVFAYPALVPDKPIDISEDRLALVVLYLKEIFYGLGIGMSVSVIFHAFSSVGQMIDNQRGMSIARILIPQLGEQGSITGALLFQMGIVLYLSMGGHLLFLQSFFHSFRALPVLEFPTAGPGMFAMADMFINITGEVIYIALQMSTPVIIAIFLTDIILGIANRMSPQINVWMLGFTLKGYIGILMLFVSITMVSEQLEYYALKANRNASATIELMKGIVPEDAPKAPGEEAGMPVEDLLGPLPVQTR